MAWSETETNIMRDVFLLMKNNSEPADTESYWLKFMEQAEQIQRKYNGHPMATDFCVAACQYYEKQLNAHQGK